MDYGRLEEMRRAWDVAETNEIYDASSNVATMGHLGMRTFMEQTNYDKSFKLSSLLIVTPCIDRPPRSVRILGYQNR